MTLSNEHIEYISGSLQFYGITSEELREDLLDHICTYIEEGSHDDFKHAFKDAMQTFGGQMGLENLQRDTELMIQSISDSKRRKAMYITGFIATYIISAGGMFKILHWPYANIILCLGFIVLNFGFLPSYFYQRYKAAITK